MKKTLSFLITLFCVAFLCAQTAKENNSTSSIQKYRLYNTYYFRGYVELYVNKNYEKAIPYFDSASLVIPYFHKPYYEKVFCHANTGNYEMAYENSVKMIQLGAKFGIIHDYLGDYQYSDFFKKFLQEVDSIYQSTMQNFDKAFCNRLKELYKFSQQNCGVDCDILHQYVEVFQQFGVPTPLNVGTVLYRQSIGNLGNYQSCNYADSEEWDTILRLINDEVNKGTIENILPLMWEDAHLSELGYPKYGIFYGKGLPYDKEIHYPTIEEMNKNRKLVGLEDFELQVLSRGLDLETVKKDLDRRR